VLLFLVRVVCAYFENEERSKGKRERNFNNLFTREDFCLSIPIPTLIDNNTVI
jgi:hypothetical protein